MSNGVFGCDNTPFFILGCVRSGTTMLRDLLRIHPRLECPEETHFFRWADPFGSPRYDRHYITMKIFQNHRKMDGISSIDFQEARINASDRRDMSDAYGKLYLAARQNPDGRWFDKTPQNVYGITLIAHYYPDAKFIHIHRHPLNVVASLVEGKVMARHSVKGAVNYWLESMIIINEHKKFISDRLIEVPYEEIVLKPGEWLMKLCEFLGEDFSKMHTSAIQTHPEKNHYQKILTRDEQNYVMSTTETYRAIYGYE